LCDCNDTEFSAFYSNQSTQKPKKYDRAPATTNARISAMLQYMLCVSRFAHYIKVLGREKVGTFTTAEAFEQYLQEWVVNYVTTDLEASLDTKSRFPLREAKVQVFEQPGKPGAYQCIMHLAPHYELDELIAAVRIATELAPARVV
jgi:type VI secretion system ImpC/EvpB family protein